MKILVTDNLPEEALELFRRSPGVGPNGVEIRPGIAPDELRKIIGTYDALAIRSATKVDAALIDAGKNLRLIGRAGIGVDNIDLAAASRRGIVVMNSPSGSSVTVAELTMALMLALARHVPAATASLKRGRWEKRRFEGRELMGKTLGVVGLGRIGALVAERALGFGMKVLACDSSASAERAMQWGASLVGFETLLSDSEIVTFHIPLNERSHHLLDARALARMKPGSYVINAARGGIVDELALCDALKSGQLAGAAFDVFEQEPPPENHPLFALDSFICTPHLGASTEEAQRQVAVLLVEQMIDYLAHGNVRNGVNVPSVSSQVREKLGPWLRLGLKLGSLAGQVAPESISALEIVYTGELLEEPIDAVTSQILKGLLSCFDPTVNEVSAPEAARERGIRVSERREHVAGPYTSLVTLRVEGMREGAAAELSVSGTLSSAHEPRIVLVDGFELEALPEGQLIVTRSLDVPGVIGALGMALGTANVNIGQIALARNRGSEAFAVVNVDSVVPSGVLQAIREIPAMLEVRQVSLP